jgi:hypothetical protein
MVWTCDMDERRADHLRKCYTQQWRETTKWKTQSQMDISNYKGYRNNSGKLGRNRRKQEWENRDS